MAAVVFEICVAGGVLSWLLAALFYLWARRDYRGPTGSALLYSPFALWDAANFTGAGAYRIRCSLLCLILFLACVGLGLVAGITRHGW